MIIGDSIAVGVQAWLIECVSFAKIGISTQQWLKQFSQVDINANGVILSLGSNDGNLQSAEHLIKLRKKIKARSVVWILPAINPNIQNHIKSLAEIHGDHIIEIKNKANDGVHPTPAEYRRLAGETKILFW